MAALTRPFREAILGTFCMYRDPLTLMFPNTAEVFLLLALTLGKRGPA